MGVSLHYNFSGLRDPYGQIEGSSVYKKRERIRERIQRAERLAVAKEIIQADIQPSDAEADDFFGQIAVDAFAVSRDFGDVKAYLSNESIFVYDFYETRSYSDDWLEKLTPELRRQVEIEMGMYITERWFEQVQSDSAENPENYLQYRPGVLELAEQNGGAVTEKATKELQV